MRSRSAILRVSHRLPWPYDERSGGLRYENVALSEGLNWTPVQVLGRCRWKPTAARISRCRSIRPSTSNCLDENFMELRRMRSFISFQPGEVRGCVGCHESRAVAPTPKPGLMALGREPSIPTPPPWGNRPLSFLRDIQPVLDRHCVACHGGLKPAAGIDLCGGLTTGLRFKTLHGRELGLDGHNRAYRSLITGGLVAYSNKSDPADALSKPLAFGSHRSKLIAALRKGACGKRVELSSGEWLRLVTWVDGNAPYHDNFINTRPDKPAYDLPADEQLLGAIATIHARRCMPCHTSQDVTRADWIDLRQPERSLFLAAPVAGDTGDHKCAKPPYANVNDPGLPDGPETRQRCRQESLGRAPPRYRGLARFG